MESIVFGSAVFFILYIFYWSIQNDKAKDQSEHRGLISMLAPKSDEDANN